MIALSDIMAEGWIEQGGFGAVGAGARVPAVADVGCRRAAIFCCCFNPQNGKDYEFFVGGGHSRVHAEASFRAYSHGWRSKSGDVRLELSLIHI